MKMLLLIFLVVALGYGCIAAMYSHLDNETEPTIRFNSPLLPSGKPEENKPPSKKSEPKPSTTPSPPPAPPAPPFQSNDGKIFYI